MRDHRDSKTQFSNCLLSKKFLRESKLKYDSLAKDYADL